MSNKWGIPKSVEEFVKTRDSKCVYCGKNFIPNDSKSKATWEHIYNDIRFCEENNVALCCASCNASKGNKKLEDWLESSYCLKNGIHKESVAQVVKDFFELPSDFFENI